MIRKKGHRYLFYSGNGWGSRGYSTGYAMCASATGPCTRPARTKKKAHPERLLVSGPKLVAPGGASAFKDQAGRIRLAFHAWNAGATHYPKSDACRTQPAGCGQRRDLVPPGVGQFGEAVGEDHHRVAAITGLGDPQRHAIGID